MYKGMRKRYLYITKSLPLERWFIKWFREDSRIEKLNKAVTRSAVAHSATHAVWLLRKMGYDVTNEYLCCWSESLKNI